MLTPSQIILSAPIRSPKLTAKLAHITPESPPAALSIPKDTDQLDSRPHRGATLTLRVRQLDYFRNERRVLGNLRRYTLGRAHDARTAMALESKSMQ